MFPGLDISYADPAQHIYDITAAGEDLLIDYLDHDLPVRPSNGFWIQLQFVYSLLPMTVVYINSLGKRSLCFRDEVVGRNVFHALIQRGLYGKRTLDQRVF